jgi:L-asparagine transporter-like permease
MSTTGAPAWRARFLVPWAGLVASTILLAGATFGLPQREETAPVSAGAAALALLGALAGVAVVLLDRQLLGPRRFAEQVGGADASHAVRHLLLAHLVLWSLAEIPAILGLAQVLLDGNPRWHLALCGISLGILAYLMPTRARVNARLEAVLR